jgi:hypoxanthine phosphoribosyltransferase
VSLPPAHRIVFSQSEIREHVAVLANSIMRADPRPTLAAPILAGAFVFAADILRELAKHGLVLPVEFLWLRSYGDTREGADNVSVLVPPTDRVNGAHVLVLDGVLDRGRTLLKARALLLDHGAASVTSAVAVDKRRKDGEARADYAAFTDVDGFIIGYGMDDAGEDRSLPYIARID